MINLKRRFYHFAVSLDQFIWVIATLGWGFPDETISSAAWRYEQKDHMFGRIARPLIDLIFFWDKNHCQVSYETEMMRKHSPQPLDIEQAREIVKTELGK